MPKGSCVEDLAQELEGSLRHITKWEVTGEVFSQQDRGTALSPFSLHLAMLR